MKKIKSCLNFFGASKVTLDVEGYDDPVSFLIEEQYLAKPIFRTLNSDAGLELTKDDVSDLSSAIDIPENLLNKLGQDVQRNLKIIAAIEDLCNASQ